MWGFIAGKPAPTKRINIAESNLALQAAAEIEKWLGKSHQAELRLQQFKTFDIIKITNHHHAEQVSVGKVVSCL